MSFWQLIIRIAILVLTFIAGWGTKDKVDYHTKPLRVVGPPVDGQPRKIFPLFHKNEMTGKEEPLTEAEFDRIMWEHKQREDKLGEIIPLDDTEFKALQYYLKHGA